MSGKRRECIKYQERVVCRANVDVDAAAAAAGGGGKGGHSLVSKKGIAGDHAMHFLLQQICLYYITGSGVFMYYA